MNYGPYQGPKSPNLSQIVQFCPKVGLEAPDKAHNSPKTYVRGSRISQKPKNLVLQEYISISAIYIVILGEMDLKVAKLVHLAQIWTFRLLIRFVIHQQAV